MAPTRRMEFGISSAQQHVEFSDLLAIWRTAEREGYDSAWTFDHFIPILSDPSGPCLEGWTTLTALLVQVPRLRGGTLVSGNSYRHPALLANIATTLDIVSAGRLEMGIGAGWWEMEYKAYGFDYPHVSQRIGALEESIQILRSLWTEPRTDFQGRYYTITDALCEPKPVQKPHIPIWVGGSGPQLTLRVVARHATGWNTFLAPSEDYQQLLGALERHCEAAARDPAEIRRSLSMQLAMDTNPAGVEAKLQTIAEGRRMDLDAIRPRALWGTPEDIAEQLIAIGEMGVDHILLGQRAPYGDNHDDLAAFAREVIPKLRAAGY